jgi:uncharacterized membrane protein YczE
MGVRSLIGKFLKFTWFGWKRFARDWLIIQIGFLLFGLAINVMVQASLGLDPWDVLQMALTYHMPITLGESNIGVAFIIILIDIALKEPLGWGTIANMIFIGTWVDILRPYVPRMAGSVVVQLAYLLFGVLIMGFATAIYIGVDAGAGPRDTLMLAISRLAKTSVRIARTIIEVSVVVLGWLLGGPAWLGTLVSAIAIGPAVQFGFKILRVRPRNAKDLSGEGD